jgi:hypothetical protein
MARSSTNCNSESKKELQERTKHERPNEVSSKNSAVFSCKNFCQESVQTLFDFIERVRNKFEDTAKWYRVYNSVDQLPFSDLVLVVVEKTVSSQLAEIWPYVSWILPLNLQVENIQSENLRHNLQLVIQPEFGHMFPGSLHSICKLKIIIRKIFATIFNL